MKKRKYLYLMPMGAVLFSVCCSKVNTEIKRIEPGPSVINMRLFYPTPFDKVYHYINYLHPKTMSAVFCDRWGDDNDSNPYNGDFTFTIHRVSYPRSGDWRNHWCPRIDDVMKWQGDKLYYTDTYRFYPPANHTFISPAHIWADEYMTVAKKVPYQTYNHVAKHLTHQDCGNLTDGAVIHTHPFTRAFRALVLETTDWSPYTGGVTNPVPVVRLDQTTYIRNTEDAPLNDFFKEEWFFVRIAGRYIPIHTIGYHQFPDKTRAGQWDMRLASITDR